MFAILPATKAVAIIYRRCPSSTFSSRLIVHFVVEVYSPIRSGGVEGGKLPSRSRDLKDGTERSRKEKERVRWVQRELLCTPYGNGMQN